MGRGVSWCSLLVAAALSSPVSSSQAQEPSDLNSLGVQRYDAKDWVGAIEAFEQAYELSPGHETVRRNLANAYQASANELASRNDYASAVRQLELAIGVDAQSAHPLIQLGAYYIKEGLINDAIFRLEEAIELSPRNIDAHYLLGEAYYKDNDVSAALDQWEWVYKVDPGREGLKERLESALREEDVEWDFKGKYSRNFNITYNPKFRGRNVHVVLDILESAYRTIGKSLGNAYPPTPIQVSLYSQAEFSESTQMGEHVGALYDGTKIRCPVFDPKGEYIEEEELKRRLWHEYVHVVVRFLTKNNVPWWLNEGLAETLSREINESELDLLRRAKEDNILFSLEELSPGQLDNLEVHSLKLAYRQSHATVAHLKKRFGTLKIALLLRSLGEGEDQETALRYSCRYTLKTLELAVADYIEKS